MSDKEKALSYLSELQHKPLDKEFDGEVAEAVNVVVGYLVDTD